MNYYLYKSNDNKHKLKVVFKNEITKRENTIRFGQYGASDYLLTNDDERKRLYRERHYNDNILDLNYPGSWSYWILWNKKNIDDSILNMEKKFNINIINRLESY
tara:strand:- start:399 stop:710 length:312 start_codon:yes stop_codon:yes gene_type:complete